VLFGIDYLVAVGRFLVQPDPSTPQPSDNPRGQVGAVFVQMFEVRLFSHWRFIDVIVDRDVVVVGDFSQLFDVFDI